MSPILVCTDGPLSGRSFEITTQGLHIGRDPGNEVHLEDNDVSRRHARVLLHNGAVWVQDAGSRNGVFVNEGQIADIFTPGTYTLETQNLPILSTLKGWKYGFSSPFKAEVYFANTRRFTDLKWGTKNPIMLRDAEFGPIRLRSFGTYAIRVAEAGRFLKEIVGYAAYRVTGRI